MLQSSIRLITNQSFHHVKIPDSRKAVCALSISALRLNMDFEKVKEGLEKKSFLLLDVRAKEEWDEERIPGARNLPGMSACKLLRYRLTTINGA